MASRLRRCSLPVLGGLLLLSSPAFADSPPPATAPASSAQALPPLPVPPSFTLPKPEAKDLEELDARLTALTSDRLEERDAAARELLEVKPRLVPAISFRLHALADRADKEAMKRMFSDIRTDARERAREAQGGKGTVETPDYLAMLVQEPKRRGQAYQDLLRVVGMSRMLTQIGTTEATRVLIDVYVRFGEFLRIHTQRELAALGERAVPALVEARRHPAEKIRTWARRQLDILGRAVPSEAVRTSDYGVLADVLRAYGRIRDPDASRIIVSFANSERAIVRDAARQAIVLLGEVSTWQLREAYENTVGKRPPRDWSWERTARELFAEFDRMRSAEVAKIYDQGRVAQARGDLDAMRRAFDDVLAKAPRFEPRRELAEGYLAYAASVEKERPDQAEAALFRALRLTDDDRARRRIESQLLTLRARTEIEKGTVDRTLLTRALDLDPENALARKTLDDLARGEPEEASTRTRHIAASTIALAALGALFVILRRRPDRKPTPEPQPQAAQPPSPPPPESAQTPPSSDEAPPSSEGTDSATSATDDPPPR